MSLLPIQMPQSDDLRLFIFPAALLLYYFICWLLIGRDPKIRNVAPQYEPPPGISPAVARYVLIGGSDGTTLAAVLTSLAAKHVVSVQPDGKIYRIKLVNEQPVVMPEEAALAKTLFSVDLKVEAYAATRSAKAGQPRLEPQSQPESSPGPAMEQSSQPSEAVLDPLAGEQLRSFINSIQATLSRHLQGIYFRWNSGFVTAGIIATFVWGLAVASRVHTPQGPPLFITFWLLFFTTVSGVVIAGVWHSRPGHPTPAQRIQQIVLPLLFFGLPGFMIYYLAPPNGQVFVVALLCSVALNSTFFILMRAPTAEGRRILQQLAGFKEFLVRVEQDRLERLNSPSEKAVLMDRFLPYAIALNVREGWGDSMAAAFSKIVVKE